MKTRLFTSILAASVACASCTGNTQPSHNKAIPKDGKLATLEAESSKLSAKDFIEKFNNDIKPLSEEMGAAHWVRATYITQDTAKLAAKASERYQAFLSAAVDQAKTYDLENTDPETARALKMLLSSTSMPAPNDAAKRAELSQISTEMEGIYGSGKYCKDDGKCLEIQELENIMATSRNYDEQLDAWLGWREISPQLKPMYARFVELTKQGAIEFGHKDLAAMWKSNYDMPVASFEAEADRLWSQVKPLYEELHCYVRSELNDTYGDDKVKQDSPIPAHLLGNMWAQTWNNIYDLVEPYPGQSAPDISDALVEQGYDAVSMTQTAEQFFVSLGMPSLPASFWENSMLTKPQDRNVVCHASAWDLGDGEDPRIKQCVEPTAEQFSTLHHELGHIYYYLLYKDLNPLFKTGAHDGFHEAIGDTIVLSMTPEYLKKKGLIEKIPEGKQAKINQQMLMALEKIAFLPFGKLIDEWRWQVFSGEISEDQYNTRWWELREKYQGIAPPVERGENFFDPGAKYHIPGNTPYIRYFLSFIIQFQFHKALCDAAGHEGALSDCSIYDSKAAGKRLSDVLAMGASKPWPEAMEALTGQQTMDASALLEYFEPLRQWLSTANKGRSCGW